MTIVSSFFPQSGCPYIKDGLTAHPLSVQSSFSSDHIQLCGILRESRARENMRTIEVLSALLLLAVAVSAQYNYPKPPPPPPSTPKNLYLPPTTTKAYESDIKISPDAVQPDDGWTEDGAAPFDFKYAVKDDVGNDFSHQAESNGDVVKGEYRTLLPDGRLQVVKYTADWKNGYNAEITYEGEPSYPEPPKPPPKKNPYENEEIIDSQGLTPPPKPKPTTTRAPYVPPPPPPTTTRAPYVPPPPPRTTRPPYIPPPPPPTTRPTLPPRTTQPPVEPPGLYGAPNRPFGVRNNPKFGY